MFYTVVICKKTGIVARGRSFELKHEKISLAKKLNRLGPYVDLCRRLTKWNENN